MLLPRSGAWMLKRKIPGTHYKDAMGCYPLLCCDDWSALSKDINSLNDELVTCSCVTDPFGNYSSNDLGLSFDFAIPYKEHYIVNLSLPSLGHISSHHRRDLRQAEKRLEVIRCENPVDLEDLYKRSRGEGFGAEVKRRIMIMARHIVYMVMAIEVNPTTYYLKINYEYGVKVKKSLTVDRVFSEALFKATLAQMYEDLSFHTKGAIKLTLNVSNFSSQHKKTLSLMDFDEDIHENKLSKEIQKLRERFGLDIIKTGDEL